MNRIFWFIILLILTTETKKHPSVVRVQVGSSFGSGVAIATDNNQTLILSCYHVTQDNQKIIKINNKPAKLIATDSTWDLSAFVIDEKLPISRLSNIKPKLRDWLTVCGFGSNDYRESRGQVVGFFSPASQPTDWIAINTKARSGDSGGPLFYDNETVAAILFGSDNIGAHGTNCIRIRDFLTKIKEYDILIKEALNEYRLF